MAKNKKPSKFSQSLRDIEDQIRSLEKKAAKEKSSCLHRSKKSGKPKFVQIKGSIVMCEKCKDTFDVKTIDKAELENAVETVHNALQQVRCLVEIDREKDLELAAVYGDIDYNLKQLVSVYEKLKQRKASSRKKHNRHDNSDFYGRGITYLGKK